MERHSQGWQISRQQKGGMQIGRGTSKGSGSGGASGGRGMDLWVTAGWWVWPEGTPGRAGNGHRWSQADGGHERIARDGGATFGLG